MVNAGYAVTEVHASIAMGPLSNEKIINCFAVVVCEDGTFGYDCINNCSGNCLDDSPCNKQTGHCEGGCKPGYTNVLCNKRIYMTNSLSLLSLSLHTLSLSLSLSLIIIMSLVFCNGYRF